MAVQEGQLFPGEVSLGRKVIDEPEEDAVQFAGNETALETDCRNEKHNSRSKDLGRSISVWKLLFKYADSTDIWLMALGTLGSVADGISTPVLMVVLSQLVNTLGRGPSANPSGFIPNTNKNSVYFVYIGAGVWFAAFLEAYCWTKTGERQASRMRTKFLRGVLRQNVGFFDTQGTTTAEVISSVTNDTLVIQDVLGERVPNFIRNTAYFFGSYAVGFYLAWRLALVGLPFVAVLIVPGIMYGRILVGIARKMQAAYDIAGSVAEQALSSIRTVFSFVGEERTMDKFMCALDGSVELGLKQGLLKGMAIGSGGVIFGLWAFLCWYGSRLVMYHGASGGRIFVTGSALIMGGLALGTALPNVKHFSEACVAGYRIFQMIDRVPDIDPDDAKGEILDAVSGEIEFRNVEFAYPSRPDTTVFHNFCLTVPAGKTVALVGGSGSGKSTAIALVERFYDPLSGQILLDGVDIRTLQLKWMRSQIGLVSQEPALFATSIKENILFGKEDATMEQVVVAAKAANAHNFVTQLPDAYDTQVGERGVQMSGGQKQRIAIARAMVKDPRILLLDEATSALDAESEKAVQGALDHASLGRTTIIVAHRLSTIRNADFIAVVRARHVVEFGPHRDLVLLKSGAYAALVQLQQSEAEPEEDTDGERAPARVSSTRAGCSSFVSRSSSNRSVPGHGEHPYEDDGKVSSAPSFGRLLLMNAPEWKQALMGCCGAIGYGSVQPIHSFTLGSMISMFFLHDNEDIKSKTRTYSLVFFAQGVFCFLVNVVQHYNFAAMGELLTKRVREQVLSKVLTFEVGWFDRDENSSGAVCSTLATEATVVRSLVGDRLSLVVQTLSAVTIAFTMGLIIAWRLAVVMIAVQPLVIACFYTRNVLLKTTSARALGAQHRGSQLAAEAVGNHRTITAFASQERILRLFGETQEGPRRESIKQSWFAGLGLGTSQLVSFCIPALIFWYGGHLVYKGSISSGEFVKTFLILISTGQVIAEAGSMTSDLAKGSDAVKSLFAVLDRKTRIDPDDGDGLKPEKIEGNVEVRNVDFAYPSRPDIMILRNFNLRIKAGTSVALVGQSGSGKSTIVGLLERFYDPLRGTVRIDDKDMKTFHLRFLREHIALVGQEPALFAGSIRENILYGNETASESEMIDAAKAANAHYFISCMKNGYDTNSGDRGVQLSGGKKQRIAIARAIIKRPSILLLDEATSALDAQSEKVVQEALDRVMVGRTSVVIAHRLSTVQNADSIAVIQDGTIVEQGSHSVLINKGERSSYFALVKLQQHQHNS